MSEQEKISVAQENVAQKNVAQDKAVKTQKQSEKSANKKRKRKFGDRPDGRRLKKIDPMHAYMPYMLPNRTDNEACMNDYIDVTALEKYIAEKNAAMPDFKYTVFHAVLAALGKTIYMRPKMNYFYQAYRLYERNDISFSFTAKRKFEDGSDEALAIMKLDVDSDVAPIEQFHSKLEKFVTKVRKKDQNDGATDIMGTITKFPRCIIKLITAVLRFLEYHGWLPRSVWEVDPYHTSVFVSNLGSIKSTASYHHLANWGTNSVFVIIGEIKKRPTLDENGNTVVKRMMPVGFTLDERIADGFYFAKSFKIFKHLLENPELLDRPVTEKIDFEV